MRAALPSIVLLCASLCACTPSNGANAPPHAASEADAVPGAPRPGASGRVAIPNAAQPTEGLLTGGQPSRSDLERAANAGYGTVVSLRSGGEPGAEDEREWVEALGMRFVSIPVAGPGDLTEQNARRLAAALAESDKPAIVHCASGNRAGALLALKAFHVDGMGAEEALALGERAGLTGLRGAVEERLTR